MQNTLYDSDHYTWTQEQARLLREGKLNELDFAHLAEEMEDMGKSELRSFASYLNVIAAYLLKWEYQPERRGSSWEKTIKAQRKNARDELADNPGMKGKLDYVQRLVSREAIAEAASDLKEHADRLPDECSYTIAQILDDDFWPDRDNS